MIKFKCKSCSSIISGSDLKVDIDDFFIEANKRANKNFEQFEKKYPNKDTSFPILHKVKYVLCSLCGFKNYF